MAKYAKIAGLEKEAIPKRLGKRLDFGKIPRNLMGKNKPKYDYKDPGYLFLNSGRFQRLMLPPVYRKVKEKTPLEVQDILDMFGRPVGPSDLFAPETSENIRKGY